MKLSNILKRMSVATFAMLIFALSLNTSLTYGYRYYYYEDDYPSVYDAYWSNKTAKWLVDGYASKYEVSLYRDGRRITTKTTTSKSISFSSYMTGGYDYYFEVRPYNRYTGWGGYYSSDSIYVDRYYRDKYDYYDYRYRDYRYDDRDFCNDISYAVNAGPPINSSTYSPSTTYAVPSNGISQGASTVNRQTLNVPAPQSLPQLTNGLNSAGTFVETFGAWHFVYPNGAYATNTWVQYNNKWYYFDLSGTMATGLYTINGSTYYLNRDGSMTVGTAIIDGTTHYFNVDGVMVY